MLIMASLGLSIHPGVVRGDSGRFHDPSVVVVSIVLVSFSKINLSLTTCVGNNKIKFEGIKCFALTPKHFCERFLGLS